MADLRRRNMEILLIQPRGFCAGVQRAISIVEAALEKYGRPIWVLHEIVHNKYVISELEKAGAIFEEDIEKIPDGVVTIFSAHGVANAIEHRAREKGLKVIDATCPLVKKVHYQANRYAQKGYEILLIGHHGHPEVEGTLGRVEGRRVTVVSNLEEIDAFEPKDPEKVAYVTQTTLSIQDTKHLIRRLKERFPGIIGPETKDICYATQSRQEAVMKAAKEIDLLLVVGSKNSSNSNRLKETGQRQEVASYLIDDRDDLDPSWLEGAETIGITAGASAPEILVKGVVDRITQEFNVTVREMEDGKESSFFRMPELPDFG
jgi:4-hydroxy-3-methylbut-2-enyl diphosphate reductase